MVSFILSQTIYSKNCSDGSANSDCTSCDISNTHRIDKILDSNSCPCEDTYIDSGILICEN